MRQGDFEAMRPLRANFLCRAEFLWLVHSAAPISKIDPFPR
jgi:hypothetical protein